MTEAEHTTDAGQKADLLRYLGSAREALLWKLDGLGEYDMRRPLVSTGTNLLGLAKHAAGTESGYLGAVFGRPFPEDLPWMSEDAPENSDMWATESETSEFIRELYRRVWQHSDATIAALDLDAPGVVPWWSPERRNVSLRQILLHVIAETNRHAGHADIVRELIDGNVGLRQGMSNLPDHDPQWWASYRERLEAVARGFAGQ
jgi:uncharacterized damage-inducible protein DinB